MSVAPQPVPGSFAAGFRGAFAAIFSDSAARATIILAVILYSFFYPAAYQAEVARQLPVVAVDLDQSGFSRELILAVAATQGARLTAVLPSVAAGKEAIARGEADGMVVIPHGLTRDTLRGHPGEIAIYGAGANLNRARTVLTAMGAAVQQTARSIARRQAMAQGAPLAPAVDLVERPLYNVRQGYGATVVPAVAPLIIQQTLLFGVVMMAGTRREKTGRLRYSAPALLGIWCAFLIIGVLNALYYEGWMFALQDYPVWGGIGSALVVTLAFLAAVVSFSLFVGSFFRTRERGTQLLAASTLPIFFLSGFTWPSIPEPLRAFAAVLPSTPGINAMVRVNQMGVPLRAVAPELGALLLLTLGYGVLAWLRLVRFPERSWRPWVAARGRG